jgi:hypothetical protein
MRKSVCAVVFIACLGVQSSQVAAQFPPPSPPGMTATLELQEAERVARLFVIVTVEVTCAPFDSAFFGSSVSVNVQQLQGRFTVSGFGATPVVCDNTPHIYEVNVSSFFPGGFPRLHPGPAAAQATYFGCGLRGGFFVCDTGSATEEIHIKG